MCRDQTSCSEMLAHTSEAGEADGQGVVLEAEPGPSGWRNAHIAANGRSEGGPPVQRDWLGTWTQANGPTLHGEAMDGGIHSITGRRSQETRARKADAAAMPT